MHLPEPRADWALFLDFDGTVVEIAPTPDAVRVQEPLPSLLVALREALGGAVAIVTGRPIAQIDAFLGAAVPAVAGLHGLEKRTADGATVSPPSPNDELSGLRALLEDFAATRPGVLVENKKHSLALHYRLDPSLKHACGEVLNAVLNRDLEGWEIVEGKMVFEIRPRGFTKGTAIEAFMGEAPFLGRTPVFCGDDTTDEDGFAAVNARGGVSVLVGDRSATRAAVRVDTVGELLDWLARIAGAARPSS